MNGLINRLIDQLKKRGLEVVPGDTPGTLKLVGKTQEADANILRALKAFKPQLLERFGGVKPEPKPEPVLPVAEADAEPCPLCDRMIDATDRETIPGNPLLCDRGGAVARRDHSGKVIQEAVARCPYKDRQ